MKKELSESDFKLQYFDVSWVNSPTDPNTRVKSSKEILEEVMKK